MTEVASQGDISYGDELWIGPVTGTTGGTVATWTQIYGVEEVGMPEKTPDDVDFTHQQSPGRSKETKPGLLAAADWSQDLQFWPAHASQILLDALATLTEAGTPEDVYFEFNVGGMRRTYRGYVNTFVPSGTVGDKRMAALSGKIFERISPNPREVA
ncbi:phage tail protein [Paenirhodobacter enshiensis]|uniref:Phage tail protein n=1 Tax=Paenirhodobacter enshiensis TaxID=1105367 RepID=A0A086XQM6_9RHOB|nr:phage tail tube protein [Paenirhodobacter enshiensis]KFI24326.1 hypothetical protein CG50_10790 [Paenirhodobacter enshiensis]